MLVLNFVQICTFTGKAKMLICFWHLRKTQGIITTIGIPPLGTMNIGTKFHGNSSNSC